MTRRSQINSNTRVNHIHQQRKLRPRMAPNRDSQNSESRTGDTNDAPPTHYTVSSVPGSESPVYEANPGPRSAAPVHSRQGQQTPRVSIGHDSSRHNAAAATQTASSTGEGIGTSAPSNARIQTPIQTHVTVSTDTDTAPPSTASYTTIDVPSQSPTAEVSTDAHSTYESATNNIPIEVPYVITATRPPGSNLITPDE